MKSISHPGQQVLGGTGGLDIIHNGQRPYFPFYVIIFLFILFYNCLSE
jgi:F0F1-type ATP synthase membrane subunit a